eukprot:CAMPEP_0119322754 /NCGR_PEP_ID=MMETSP1333-20130426/59074_1 /TAXON_ID=418940 /ORGANISM="Scyphosphaera apsteinii, Strain RCC1455" /LENGTH=117 /DNA_ID=CAMNT_0007330057 /DNA_START=604 /DNA_END=958 /DNA_ORIENTATION=-
MRPSSAPKCLHLCRTCRHLRCAFWHCLELVVKIAQLAQNGRQEVTEVVVGGAVGCISSSESGMLKAVVAAERSESLRPQLSLSPDAASPEAALSALHWPSEIMAMGSGAAAPRACFK